MREESKFIDIPFSTKNLDVFIIRNAILRNLSLNLNQFKGNLLDVGCGKMPYKEYILENSEIITYKGLDLENSLVYDEEVKPDFIWDGQKMSFEDSSYSTVLATEVLEHCPDPEIVIKEVYRILKPGGVFFFTVPFLWNLHEVPNDEYRYTPFSLQRHLNKSGFSKIKINATGGWHASLAQMLGLWVRRSPMNESKRRYLSIFLKPVIKYLIKLDKPEKVQFIEGQMITGLSGVAIK